MPQAGAQSVAPPSLAPHRQKGAPSRRAKHLVKLLSDLAHRCSRRFCILAACRCGAERVSGRPWRRACTCSSPSPPHPLPAARTGTSTREPPAPRVRARCLAAPPSRTLAGVRGGGGPCKLAARWPQSACERAGGRGVGARQGGSHATARAHSVVAVNLHTCLPPRAAASAPRRRAPLAAPAARAAGGCPPARPP